MQVFACTASLRACSDGSHILFPVGSPDEVASPCRMLVFVFVRDRLRKFSKKSVVLAPMSSTNAQTASFPKLQPSRLSSLRVVLLLRAPQIAAAPSTSMVLSVRCVLAVPFFVLVPACLFVLVVLTLQIKKHKRRVFLQRLAQRLCASCADVVACFSGPFVECLSDNFPLVTLFCSPYTLSVVSVVLAWSASPSAHAPLSPASLSFFENKNKNTKKLLKQH